MRILVTRGLPGSGKTTFAEHWVGEAPGRININRDTLRAALGVSTDGTPGSLSQENAVTQAFRLALEEAIKIQADIIISDTNLVDKHLIDLISSAADIAHRHQIPLSPSDIDIIDFNRSPEQLRRTNEQRGYLLPPGQLKALINTDRRGRTPAHVLISEAWKQHHCAISRFKTNPQLPHCILVDIDGTLALMGERSPFATDETLLDDAPNTAVIATVAALHAQGYPIIVVSGRQESTRSLSETWLKQHGIAYEELFMRATGDSRPDWMIKHEIIENQILPHYQVLLSLDDRDQVVHHNRAAGMTVFQVAPGNF